jgi:hypothetical protein
MLATKTYPYANHIDDAGASRAIADSLAAYKKWDWPANLSYLSRDIDGLRQPERAFTLDQGAAEAARIAAHSPNHRLDIRRIITALAAP